MEKKPSFNPFDDLINDNNDEEDGAFEEFQDAKNGFTTSSGS